jgi:hypothetical protein
MPRHLGIAERVRAHFEREWRAAGFIPAVRTAGINPAARPPLYTLANGARMDKLNVALVGPTCASG